ncbi:MAG: hypothetical protein NTY40_01055, partial [Synechococcus sp. LacPavin_0920_WC12_MAG_50_7]|nr:hypothetical protein [Synechococcus sp. LacPavin_0920_WC12_MAG_50_7]
LAVVVFAEVFALTATFFTSFSALGIISATAGISSSTGAKVSETAVAVMRTKMQTGDANKCMPQPE